MNYDKLQKLRQMLYFTVGDVAGLLGIKQPSARVLCNRYAKKGIFIRLKNNFYILEQNWQNFPKEDFLKIANFLQVPSYISFMSALSFYEVTTQVQQGFFESASLKRSLKVDAKGVIFSFYKLKKEHYFDFIKYRDIFIATKEKALVDAVYLYSLGKYKLDFSSIDYKKLDKNKLKKILKVFPPKTKEAVQGLCRI